MIGEGKPWRAPRKPREHRSGSYVIAWIADGEINLSHCPDTVKNWKKLIKWLERAVEYLEYRKSKERVG